MSKLRFTANLLEWVVCSGLLNDWFLDMARETILDLFTGQDGVVNVIVYSRPVHRETSTLFYIGGIREAETRLLASV